jgi:hypothetical protein
MTDAPFSLDLEQEVKDLFKTKMGEFIAFCANNWTLTDQDLLDVDGQVYSPDYLRGYNAAIALDFWFDENGYDR